MNDKATNSVLDETSSQEVSLACIQEDAGSNPARSTSGRTRYISAERVFTTVWEMRKDGYADSTMKATSRRLRMIAKSVSLDDPDAVKGYFATKTGKPSYKEGLADAYDRYCRYNGLSWRKPRYKRRSQPPYVPTEEEITILTTDAGRKYSLILCIFRDTGMRPIELERARLRWFDLQRGLVNVETAKYGRGRVLQLQPRTLAMLKEYVGKHSFSLNDHLFPKTRTMRTAFQRIRQRTAEKLSRPELLKICLYSFRHYFATMLFQRTKDILHVQRQLGHRSLRNTILYTHLVDFNVDNYVVKAAQTVGEAKELLEVGFEYVCDRDQVQLFRKRK